jgi:hypothetical protein
MFNGFFPSPTIQNEGDSLTLLADGPSDAALLPVLTWLLREHVAGAAFAPRYADFRRLPDPPRRDDHENRINIALIIYPCDLLFFHRDAENQPPSLRQKEIGTAIAALRLKMKDDVPPCICVIPVRMTEAWLLFDEQVVRRASGNPNGKVSLDLPKTSKLEALPKPKQVLHELLTRASELAGRRKKDFNVREAVWRVARLLDDFSPLRSLPAFNALEKEIQSTLNRAGFVD